MHGVPKKGYEHAISVSYPLLGTPCTCSWLHGLQRSSLALNVHILYAYGNHLSARWPHLALVCHLSQAAYGPDEC